MKRWLKCPAIVMLSLLILASLAAAAESVRVVSNLDNITAGFNVHQNGSGGASLSLEVPAVAITPVTVNSREYQQVDLPGAEHLFLTEPSAEGEPAVPSMTAMLAIPDQVGIELNVTYSGFDTFEDIDLAPVQPSPADNDPEAVLPFTQNMTTYTTDAFYPGELAVADEPVIMRDVRGVQIELRPVQYNPVRRELRVYRELAVSITYGGEPINPKLTRTQYLSDGFYPLYKSTFANFEEMFSTAEVKRGGYVIICKPTLVDTLKAVALWKHQKGYTSRIVPTTDIAPGGSPTSSQIFTYLRTAYQTWEVPPEYVMLVGDVDGTFTLACWPYNGYPSDHHYACVDGSDFLPDIFVARMSVDNMLEARIAFSKILKYEKTPFMGDSTHWIRGFSCGWTLFNTARLTTLWARELAMLHGFSRVDTVYGGSHDPRVASIMNTGPAYIWYRGEGGPNGWWGIDYSISDLLAMPKHQKLGVMSPLTCGLGNFGVDPSFGETWIRMGTNPDSLNGGPAFYGVSDGGTHTMWNNPIMVGYFFGIFEQNIYHFAAAAVAGKMQDWRTFPRNRNVEVQQYFNTYNMQGDPELELRKKIPVRLEVTYQDTVGYGLNHLEVNVVDIARNAISDAYVTLIKMNGTAEEVYSLGKTDEHGNVELSFDAPTPGNMILTVSGQDLYPFQGNVALVPSDIAVGFDSLAIDDDTAGFSQGNGDSLANPNETLELYVTLKNFGDSLTANNITTNITPLDDGMVDILDPNRNYGDLGPGESRTDNRPYLIHVRPDLQDGDLIRLRQTVTDQNNDSWFSIIEIPVKAPQFVVSRVTIQDINNRLDPGDTANMVLTLINTGHAAAQGVSASITSQDDFTSIIDANTSFGDMPVGDTATSAADSVIIAIDRDAFAGRTVNFALNVTAASGARSSVPFHATVDSVLVGTDPTGPDDYGYYMYDKNDTAYSPHPHYNWVEINPYYGGPGSRLNFGGQTDDKSVLVTLPFDLVYYGQHYGVLIVCINGFVAPDTFRMDMGGNYWANFFNWPMPDPGNARAQISPLWDDLSFSGSNYGVYTWSDPANHKYYIEWYRMVQRNPPDSTEYFQMVISDPAYYPTLTGDAEILFQYLNVNNLDNTTPWTENYSTVGFESWDQISGLQYTHDNTQSPGASPLRDSMAILITTNTGRGGIKGHVALDDTPSGIGVRITASTGQNRITGNDGNYWLRNLPPGQVSLRAELSGYFPVDRDTLNITANSFLPDIDFALTRCPIPASLEASDNVSYQIEIAWTPISHPYCVGYHLYRSLWRDGEYIKLNDAPLTATSYIDRAFPDSGTYWYYVTAAYSQGSWTGESMASVKDAGRVTNPVGINDNEAPIPGSFFLSQNYPNPFNPTTTISYGLPKDCHVKLEIYNIIGQKALTLIDEDQKAGYRKVSWDGRDRFGKSLASGIYFYRLRAGGTQLVHKMSLIK